MEQAKLREEYIEGYRRSVRHHIEGIKIVDEEGKKYVDSTRFALYVGISQPDARSISLTGQEPVKVDITL